MNLEIVAQKEILPRKANQRSYSLTVIRLLYLTYRLQICSFTSYWQDYLIVLLFFSFGTGDKTQGSTHTEQVLYH